MQRSYFLWRKSENLQTLLSMAFSQATHPRQKWSNTPSITQWQSNKLIGCVDRPKRDPKQATLLSLPASFINHKVEFLVDSGAEKSVIPRNLVPNALLYPSGVTLTGVGGNEIQPYGLCHVSIGIKGLRRQFPITFKAVHIRRRLFEAAWADFEYEIKVFTWPSHFFNG